MTLAHDARPTIAVGVCLTCEPFTAVTRAAAAKIRTAGGTFGATFASAVGGGRRDARVAHLLFPTSGLTEVAACHGAAMPRGTGRIVVDEHGGTAGIVTLDDSVEELTGEVLNELRHERPRSLAPQADGSIFVRGDAPLHEVNHELELELAGDGQTTIAGLRLLLAGGVPKEGALLQAADGTRLRVERASSRTVDLVRIFPPGDGSVDPRD